MKNKSLPTIRILSALLVAISLADCLAAETEVPSPTLKDTYKNAFRIGVAINQRQFTGEDTNGVALINAQFNSISPENVLKWEIIHPQPGTNGYDFEPGDRYVEFGEKHGMYIVGHTLIWHSQTPRWVFQDGTNRASREVL